VVSRAYPLEAAALDRQGKRAQRELELAAATRALKQAEAALVEARDACAAQLALRPSVDEGGQAAGRELRRSAAFARRHARELEALRAAQEAATARARAAREHVDAARAALGEAHAREQVLEHDRERFLAADRKQTREAEQDELDEQHAARLRPRPR
jgi:hypothetical protein